MNLLVFGLLLVVLPASANAYFDPGTGSLIIQALIGAMAAVTVFWGQLRTYVRSLFSSRSNKEPMVLADTEDHEKDFADSED